VIRSLDNSFIFIAYPRGLNSIENYVFLYDTNPYLNKIQTIQWETRKHMGFKPRKFELNLP